MNYFIIPFLIEVVYIVVRLICFNTLKLKKTNDKKIIHTNVVFIHIGLVPENLTKTWDERTKFMTRRKLEMTIRLFISILSAKFFNEIVVFLGR